jgi:hypothetical protein
MVHRGLFRVNPSQVVHEAFDGEALVINLDTGTYYSLTGSSWRLWLLVTEGTPVDAIVRTFLSAHDGDPTMITNAVHDFLDRLRGEGLILEDEAQEDAVAPSLSATVDAKTPFSPFEMAVFTDMQDLLLLDPIHDVEDAGWPVAQRQNIKPASS